MTLIRKNKAREGFTLVELLVVIGIISLLLAILIPSINRARQGNGPTTTVTGTVANFGSMVDGPNRIYYVNVRTENGGTEEYRLSKDLYEKLVQDGKFKFETRGNNIVRIRENP